MRKKSTKHQNKTKQKKRVNKQNIMKCWMSKKFLKDETKKDFKKVQFMKCVWKEMKMIFSVGECKISLIKYGMGDW